MSDPDLALPAGYNELLEDLKHAVAQARWQSRRVVNTELLRLYWQLGDAVLQRQRTEGWGTRVIDRLATDLRAAFPDMRGLSRSNIKYMRQMAATWPPDAIGQQPVGQLPWGHVTVLLDKLHDQAERDWYAASAVQQGWSRNVLLNQIMNQLHRRAGAAPSNFAAELAPTDSELAQQLTRDPYVLDFLDLTTTPAEPTWRPPWSTGSSRSCSSSATGSRSSAGSTTSRSTATTPTSTRCSSTGPSSVSSSSSSRSAASSPSTPASSASTSPGSTRTCATTTGTPPPSGSCCAPAATTTSSATSWPTPPHRSPSPTTPTTPSPPPSPPTPNSPP